MNWKLTAINMLGEIFSKGKKQVEYESKNHASLFKKLINYPIKLIATFIFAPIILIKVISHSDTSLIRKLMAMTGLVLAGLAVYSLSLTITIGLGFVIKSQLGILSATAYTISVLLTTWLTILIQVAIFNTISTVMLKITQSEVIEYLNDLTNGKG